MSLATLSEDSSLDCRPRFGTSRDFSRATYGGHAAEIARALGTPLMPWQQHVLDVALEVGEDGKLVHRRVLLTVPRQSGKTTLLLVLFVLRALKFGSSQVMSYAAQTGVDARKKFVDEHVPLLRRSPLEPLFRVRMTNGHEALLWQNGSRHHISAGTEKSGHGATLDLAVVDEAFAQPDGRLEQAFSPAMLTRPEPQLWFVSTAGSPSDLWFRQKVDAGRSAVDEDGVAYFEWSAPEDADPADRDVWRSCMPALGHTVRESTIAAEFLSMPLDEFRRAYLNQWVDKKSEQCAIDAQSWLALVDPSAAPTGSASIGVAVAPDRTWAAITVAQRRSDGRTHLTLADYHPSTEWVAARAAELADRLGAPITAATSARGMVARANEPGSTAQAAAHCALDDAVRGGLLSHDAEAALTTAVRAARWSSGEVRRFEPTGSVDISPLLAAALALHGLSSKSSSGGWVLSL